MSDNTTATQPVNTETDQQPPSNLLREQTFFALWLWLTVRSNFFSVTPLSDGTVQLNNWPTGTALDKLTTGLATISATPGDTTVADTFAGLQNLITTGDPGALYSVKVQDGTTQQATIPYGLALTVIKKLYDASASPVLDFYDPNDPSCTEDEILAMIPAN
jgi:hypothetical protein